MSSKIEIGKIAEVSSSKRIFANEYVSNGIPFFRSKEVGNLSRKEEIKSELFISEDRYSEIKEKFGVPQKGDLLLTSVGSIGNTWIVDDRKFYFKDGNLTCIKPSKDLAIKYLKYFFKSNQFWSLVSSNSSGTAYSALTISKIKKLKIPLPPLPIQKKIAEILDTADALRRETTAQLADLDVLAQSVFLEMFGEVVHNTKNWKVVKFGEVVNSRLGKMLDKKKEVGDNKKLYLRNANVLWNNFNLNEVYEMDFNEKEKKEFGLVYGDILMCEGGDVGRCAIWKNNLDECYFQKALHRIRPNEKLIRSDYIVNLMWNFSKYGGFRYLVSTATIAHLTGVKLKSMKIPLPPIELQTQFAQIIENIESQKMALKESLKESEDLFNGLLQEVFG